MPRAINGRPSPGEYPPYYQTYLDLVPQGDVLRVLEEQLASALALLRGIGEGQAGDRYAPGKWSIKEVVGHLIDSERVFAYRALRFGRNDPTPLPGFEGDDYVREGGFDGRSLADLAAELSAVREASLALFRGLPEQALLRRGTASGRELAVRCFPWIIAGHERHHLEVIRERYLKSPG